MGARETWLLFGDGRFDFLAGQNKRDEHGFAAAAGFFVLRRGRVRSGRQTGQAVAAVDQLFNCEEQELILRHAVEIAVHRDRQHARTNRGAREIPPFA